MIYSVVGWAFLKAVPKIILFVANAIVVIGCFLWILY